MQEQVKMSFFNVEYHIQVIDQGLYTENHYPQCFPMSSTLPGSHQIARRFSLAAIKIAGWEDQGRFNLLNPQIMSRPVISYYCSVASRSIRSLEPIDRSRSFCILLYHSMESPSGTMGKNANHFDWMMSFLWENNSIPCCKLCILVSSAALHSWGESPLGKTTVTWVSTHPNID